MTVSDGTLLAWVSGLKGIATDADLRRSAFFREHAGAISRYLNQPQVQPFVGAVPHLRQFLRAVCWNIEKGICWREIAETLRVEPRLRVADLILLNEADVGMARSGNAHVARELAQALKMNLVFAPAHFELTKGTGPDLVAPGDNTVAVQGNAILSRYPLGEAEIIELPECENYFHAEERRFGRRIAVKARVFSDKGSFDVVCVHLEVRRTPSCRAAQMRTILNHVNRIRDRRPLLLAGDWNTHSFARGTRWRTMQAYLRIGLTEPKRLAAQLKRPDLHGEKLFQVLRQHGLTWESFNDFADTCGIMLPQAEDLKLLPRHLQHYARRRMEQHDHQLRFRLDWFAAQSMRALRGHEETDLTSGVHSIDPVTLSDVNLSRPRPLSDHHPILVDLLLPAEEETQILAA